MMGHRVIILCLLSSLWGCSETETTPTSVVLAPLVAEPGGWITLPVVLRGIANTDDVAGINPQALWTSGDSRTPFKRKLSTVWVQTARDQGYVRPVLRIARVPEQPGIYQLEIDFRTVGGRASRAMPSTVLVMPFGMYFVVIFTILTILFGLSYASWRHTNSAVRWSARLALIVLSPWWFPPVLAGHTLFFGVVIFAFWLAQQKANPNEFLAQSSLLGMCFLEIYWGAVVSGSYLTAPIISLSVIGLCYITMRRFITNERKAAYGLWGLFWVQSLFFACVTVYKAFFRDYPTFLAGGDIGQVGRLLDSIAHVIRITHVMTLLMPWMFLIIWVYARRVAKKAPAEQQSADCEVAS